MDHARHSPPEWNALFSIALEQEGYFSTAQAAQAGYGPQLINHHLHAGRFVRVARGIYRLVHYPPGEHEQLIVAWLWSGQHGIIGLESALVLHSLSDVLPAEIHLIVPTAWSKRRMRVLRGLRLHCTDVPASELQWHGCLPLTTPQRTLRDLALEHASPEIVHQAVDQGLSWGLFVREEIAEVIGYLEQFHAPEKL